MLVRHVVALSHDQSKIAIFERINMYSMLYYSFAHTTDVEFHSVAIFVLNNNNGNYVNYFSTSDHLQIFILCGSYQNCIRQFQTNRNIAEYMMSIWLVAPINPTLVEHSPICARKP